MIGASLATRYGSNGTGIMGSRTSLCMRHGCCRTTVHVPCVRTAFHTLLLCTSDRLDYAANAKINLTLLALQLFDGFANKCHIYK